MTIHYDARQLTQLLLTILVLALGFGQLMALPLSGLGNLYLHDVIITLILALNFKVLIKFILEHYRSCLFWLLLFAFFASHLNLMLGQGSELLLRSALYSLRLVAYLLLFPVVVSHKSLDYPRLLLVTGSVALAIGFMQYIFMPDMRLFQHLGWDDHLDRLTMPYFDPAFTSAMLALFAILAHRLRAWPLVILTLPALVLTYARSTWLALAAVSLLRNLLNLRLFFVICILGFGLLILPKSLGEGTNLLRTYSINSRLTHDWQLLATSSFSTLVFGQGYNTWGADTPDENHGLSANNSFVQIILAYGLAGLFFTLILLKKIIIKTTHQTSLVFAIIASLFNNVLLYPFTLLWLIILLASSPSAKPD
jgi:hypothetical protein